MQNKLTTKQNPTDESHENCDYFSKNFPHASDFHFKNSAFSVFAQEMYIIMLTC